MENYWKIKKGICSIMKWIMAACLFILVLLATVQVLTRYFIAVTIIWVEELSIYLMTWMCAIGAPWIWLENCSHIRMDVLDSVLPRKVIRIMDVVIDVVTAAVGVAVTRIGIRTWSVNHGMMMSVINLDEGDRYLPVIVGGVLLVFAAGFMLIQHIYDVKKEGGDET